jgi:hypothetical protein
MTLPRSAVLGSAVVLLALAPPGPAQEPPEFGAQAELVQIDVVVLDPAGRPVSGLAADDFEVSEDGREQPIVSFEQVVIRDAVRPREEPPAVSAPRPHDPVEGRYLVAFFDDQHLSPPAAEQARRAVGPFLARELRDGDVVTVVAPVSGVWWTARTAWEHRQLPEVVARVEGADPELPPDQHVSPGRGLPLRPTWARAARPRRRETPSSASSALHRAPDSRSALPAGSSSSRPRSREPLSAAL